MSDPRTSYWRRYYARVELQARPWLDLSNEAVQAQTFGLAIEAAGAIRGRRCLDVGCGWGRLSLILQHLGAASVTAVDQISEFVASNRVARPDVRWIAGNVADPGFLRSLPEADLVFAVEMLQYVPFEETVAALWSRMRPGGRLVGVVPSRDCPIVRSTSLRLEGFYRAPSGEEVRARLESLPGVARWALRGLYFHDDARLEPYRTGAWGQEAPEGPPPNRLLFLAVRGGDATLAESR